jgi:hypothetical protein
MHAKSTFLRTTIKLPTLLSLLMVSLFLAQPALQSQTQSVTQMYTRTGPDEFDTADMRGGQIGGRLMGFGYKLLAMRCVSGQVIVGANIRRGDVLDCLRITCARPSCTSGSCTWSSSQPGMSAGNPDGGDAHPAMMCQSNEIVTGVRGRVLAFTAPVMGRRTGFDYAADIEIECSQMQSAAVSGPSGQRFYPVTQSGSGTWHHPEGGFEYAAPGVAANVVQNFITPPISCRGRGYGASSISVGIANFLGSADEPVVQAVSLFCPRIAPTAPSNSTDFRVMAPNDPMWTKTEYANTYGYFPGTANFYSNCHNFVGEMGLEFPGIGPNVCGNMFNQNISQLPPGTPHQLGDVAVVYGRLAGAPFAMHSAVYIGRGIYLQRNGASDIQVSSQNYIDTLFSDGKVFYVRPSGGLATYMAKLAAMKVKINPSEGPTPAYQNLITQIKACFP